MLKWNDKKVTFGVVFIVVGFIVFLIVGFCVDEVQAGNFQGKTPKFETERKYELYEPNITQSYVYKGSKTPGEFAYNHCPSIAYFNGKFYATWMANGINNERLAGRYIHIATSDDFVNWTHPILLSKLMVDNPIKKSVKHLRDNQPVMLNYKDKELWCIYQNGSTRTLYNSKLTADSKGKWVSQEIQGAMVVNGEKLSPYTAQDFYMLSSGRVLLPLTFISRVAKIGRDQVKYNGVFYTDDGGKTWECSNAVSLPEDSTNQWEPCVHEQADGKIRMFSRNMSRESLPPTQWLVTTTGTGVEKGQPVVFEEDLKYSYMETVNSRMQTIKLSSGRYLMFHHDSCPDKRAYESRTGGALFFSRTGADDFVAGPGFTKSSKDTIAYPQGIEHDGKIYVIYTFWQTHDSEIPRDMIGAVIDPAPSANKFYIWPRDKDVINLEFVKTPKRKYWKRTNPNYKYIRPYKVEQDNRNFIVFEEKGTAGVEIDPVNYDRGQSLKLIFDAKITKIQEKGNLVLCSFGDQMPIRIAMPSNRKGRIYVWCSDQWQDAGAMAVGKWESIALEFSADKFTIKIGNQPIRLFANPVLNPNPRLYLGDGYEIDTIESNRGSKFMIDLKSVRTRVQYKNQ